MDPPLRPAARAPLPRADSVVGPLNVTPPEPLTVDQLIEPSQARSRLETVVGPRVFAVSAKLTGERHTVAVPLKAKWQALLSILTGRFLEVGDSAFADVKEQTVQASTNIGLLSALLVAIAVQFILEAAVAPNGNGYINTYPYAWVGQLYFVMMTAAGMALFLSTSASILTVVVLNETESLEEARFLVYAAHNEVLMPFRYLFLGVVCLVNGVSVWLFIVTLQLINPAPPMTLGVFNSSDFPTGHVSTDGDGAPIFMQGPGETHYLGAMVGSAASVLFFIGYFINGALNLVAILHKARYKFSPHAAERRLREAETHHAALAGRRRRPVSLMLAQVGLEARASLFALAKAEAGKGASDADPDIAASWNVYLSGEHVSAVLDEYFELDRSAATPNGFKQFLVAERSGGAQGLSHITGKLCDVLFEEKVTAIVDKERERARAAAAVGRRRDFSRTASGLNAGAGAGGRLSVSGGRPSARDAGQLQHAAV